MCTDSAHSAGPCSKVCNVAGAATGPLRKSPAVCCVFPTAAVSQWVQLVLLSSSHPPLPTPPSCSPWGHVLGTRIACDSTWSVFTSHTYTLAHEEPPPPPPVLYWSWFSHMNKATMVEEEEEEKDEEVHRLRCCSHVQTNKFTSTMCPTNLLTWLGGWSHGILLLGSSLYPSSQGGSRFFFFHFFFFTKDDLIFLMKC